MQILSLMDLVKIFILTVLVGFVTATVAKYWFKAMGIDFKKWMARHGKNEEKRRKV